jgi:hypothetical protein
MELEEIRSKTIGQLADELGEVLTSNDYPVVEVLQTRIREQLLGVPEKLVVSALLMATINTLANGEAPGLEALTTT